MILFRRWIFSDLTDVHNYTCDVGNNNSSNEGGKESEEKKTENVDQEGVYGFLSLEDPTQGQENVTWFETKDIIDGLNSIHAKVNAELDKGAGQNWLVDLELAYLKTLSDVAFGLANSPFGFAEELQNFAKNPSLETIPGLGPLGKAIGENWAKATGEPFSFGNYSTAIGYCPLCDSFATGPLCDRTPLRCPTPLR